jgi:hypothetical protein
MNTFLLAAAALAVLLAAAHSYLGERYILVRLFRRDALPKLFGGTDFTRRTLRFAWHLTSLAWIGLAGVLLALESDGGLRVADVVAFTFAGSGLLTLVGSRGRHLAWVVFLAIAGLVWLGVR